MEEDESIKRIEDRIVYLQSIMDFTSSTDPKSVRGNIIFILEELWEIKKQLNKKQ